MVHFIQHAVLTHININYATGHASSRSSKRQQRILGQRLLADVEQKQPVLWKAMQVLGDTWMHPVWQKMYGLCRDMCSNPEKALSSASRSVIVKKSNPYHALPDLI